MANIKISESIADVSQILLNPSAIQRLSLRRLRDIKDGLIDVPDATSPFAYTLENSAINTAAFLEANEAAVRRQYPSVAQTVSDLYLHMSDKDFIDRFATPATGVFYIMIEMNALERALVYNQVTGISKVVIPRNTEFKIEDVSFSIQYPIEIKKLSHEGYQVTYDTSAESPLEVLKSNIVQKEFIEPKQGIKFLRLTIPTQQFWIKSVKSTLTAAKLFKKKISYDDNFYYARVFFKNNVTNNKWREIRTTHTDQVYDPTIITASLKVEPGTLEVFIPQIYFSTGVISGDIRIDVYQTRGKINMSLANYSMDNFTASWKTIDENDATAEVASFRSISDIIIYSLDTINNGTGSLSFSELRRRVINNTIGSRNLPITNVQIEDSLTSNGFSIVKDVDVVTNRTFLATKELINPFDERLITAAATSMQSLIITMREAAKHPAVFNNGDRITLTPDIVYRLDNGQMQIVSATQVSNILSGDPDNAAKMVNSNQFVYSPFHYVMDATESQFRLHPYHMDSPVADIRQFIDNNDSTMLEANTSNFSINRTTFGYRLTVQVKGNTTYKTLSDDRLFAQMYFVPVGEVSKAFLNGQLISRTKDGGAVFIFDFITKFDINSEHTLFLDSFTMANMLDQPVGAKLLQDFNVIYGTYDIVSINWNQNEIDTHLGQFMLSDKGYAITEESFRIEFGKHLKNMWAGCRSFTSPNQYKRYEVDIPETFPDDVFEVDPTTGTIFKLDSNNNVIYNYKHKKGDIVYAEDGSIRYAHRIGDIVYNNEGLPIPTSELESARQVDILVVEGPYYFATDPSSSIYKTSFVAAMVDWIVDDLERLRSQVLEETFIYYYPKTNMGSVQVIGENGTATYVQASQSFRVRLFVNDQVMKNSELRDSLTRTVIKTIDAELKKTVIAISNIESNIKVEGGADLLAIEVSGLGGVSNYQAVSMINIGDRLSIRKRLTTQSDGKLIVEEDVTVEFVRHSTT